eukprot:14598064-Alexandrium_andersonii.AAC.1
MSDIRKQIQHEPLRRHIRHRARTGKHDGWLVGASAPTQCYERVPAVALPIGTRGTMVERWQNIQS